MAKRLLLLPTLLISFLLQSQSLHWVGGSGNWNDVAHWSLSSGGPSANVVPGASTQAIFDNNSGSPSIVVTFVGDNTAGAVLCQNTEKQVYFHGSSASSLHIAGDFILNDKTTFTANTRLFFQSTASSYGTVNFWRNVIASDVVFERGNWNLVSVKLNDLNTLNFVKGDYKLMRSTVSAGNIRSDAQQVHFDVQNGVLFAKSHLNLGANVSFSSDGLYIVGQRDDPSLFSIDPAVNLGARARIVPPSPAACGITYSFTNPTCQGNCDASMTVNFDAGCTTGPYDILFNTSASCVPSGTNSINPPTLTLTNLCQCGGFLVDILVFDGLGYVTGLQNQLMPANPTPINANFTNIIQPNCNGDCNGAASITINGGNGPYIIYVDPATPGPVLSGIGPFVTTSIPNLCAGVHTFSVVDNNGCNRTFSTTLTQPPALLPHGTSTNITCNSFCTGAVSMAPTGGTPSYTVNWSNGVNGTSASSLCPGPITGTVTDSRGCLATYSANITQPPAMTLTVTRINLNCATSCNGSATVTTAGGQAPYTYTWTAPAVSTTSVATGLCAGVYTVTVQDNLNCVRSATFNISSPPTLSTTPTSASITCNAACTGTIGAGPGGGTPGYTYTWSPAVSTGSTATGLCAGVYTYTIGDALGCRITQTVTLTQPPATTLALTRTNITCNGVCNGSATVTASGGTPGYTYSWTPGTPTGQGTNVISGLCPGTYSVNVRDNNNCPRTGTVSITQPVAITATVTGTNPTCNGVCNGSITATAAGGSAPYTYTLQSPSTTLTSNPPYTSLCDGSYTLTIRDNLGCIRTETITLTEPNAVTLTLNATAISCAGQCNSTISTVIGGGTPAYTYSWSTGSTAASLINRCQGVYSATVTDANGCKASSSVTVTAPPSLTVSVSSTSITCNGQCDGSATANASGGTPGYTYSWTPSGSSSVTSSSLCAGNYTVTVRDTRGCVLTNTTSIIAPPAMTLTTQGSTVSCAGSCNGTASVTAIGGTPGYFYSWNSVPSQTTASASGLCPGNYAVTVTDARGCIASQGATVSQPTALTASISNVVPSCNVCIGAATVSPSGGTPPYSYNWVNGGGTTVSTSPGATGLCVGNYTVTVTDSKNCTNTATVTILQTVQLVVTTNGTVLQCNGSCSGVATANASGGITPYSYSWNSAPTQTTQVATGLCFGSYTVTVVDNLGCSNTGTVNFTNPPAITVTVTKSNVTCNAACNGSLSASASGGTGALSYQWLPGGQTTSSITGQCAGTYTVNVHDANNCTVTQTVTLTEPSALTASFSQIVPTSCIANDGSLTVTPGGGVGPYTFTWTPSGSTSNPLTGLSDGTYSVTVRDANGCTKTISTSLSDPVGPTLAVTTTSTTCFGLCNGSATVTATGTGPFTYSWSAGATPTSTVNSGFCQGTYFIRVTDNNSCVTTRTFVIAQPTQISTTAIRNHLRCNSACTGSINLTVSGGTPGYTYTWSPSGGNVQDPVNLCAGTYTVRVNDSRSCTRTATFTLTQPPALTLSFTKKNVRCNSNCNGGTRAIAGGGTTPYTYTWTPVGAFPGSNLDTITNLCAGIYSVTVRDGMGCTISGTVSITEPPALTATLTTRNIKCNGQCTGAATLTPAGGTAPYFYSWNVPPPNTSQTMTGLCAGNYIGTVVDGNSCSTSYSFTITQPAPLTVTTTPSNPLCNSVCNGSVSTAVGGGSPAYHYQWIPSGGTVQNPTGLCAGIYTVIVTDDSSCTAQSIVTLTNPPQLLANISFTNPTCTGGCDGSVSATPVGGTAPFTYNWAAPTQTTQTVNSLCVGNYTLTVTDANLCTDTKTVALTPPVPITLNPAVTPASCGVSNGSIDAVVSSGNPPYTFNWLPPVPAAQATNSVVTGLLAGIYTVVVSDASLCSATVAITLSNATGPSGATITSTNVACNGQCTGAAIISNPVGGTPGYTLSWLSPAISGSVATNLCAGSYTAVVTDANSCTLFVPVTITEPAAINDHAVITSASCFGHCDGSISIAPTGGMSSSYTYTWSTGATTSSITNLCPGTYSVSINDGSSCTYTASYNLPGLTTITSNTFATNNNCFGNCNGSLSVINVAGGLPPYTYSWTTVPTQTNAAATGLCNGSYSVTVTDNNGCFNVFRGSITSPPQLQASITSTNISCNGTGCDGIATSTPTGGVTPYTYNWAAPTQTTQTISGLCIGNYTLTVTDANTCTDTRTVAITAPTPVTLNPIIEPPTCGASNGTITAIPATGNPPFTYNWLPPIPAAQATNSIVINVAAGIYTVIVTDASTCSSTITVVVNNIGGPTAATITSTNVTCNGACNGIAEVSNAVGGSPNYTYSWLSPAVSGSVATNLCAGTYTAMVTDVNNCILYVPATITEPPAIDDNETIVPANCSGNCNGSISLAPSGGTGGYTYLWSNGATTNSVTNLCPGNYSVTVTDGASCTFTANYNLPSAVTITSTPVVTAPVCSGDCNGTILADNVGGGVAPYTYQWSDPLGQITPMATGLCAGVYSVTITDANGCSDVITATLTAPSPIDPAPAVTEPSCGLCNGAATLTPTGGNGPAYTIVWSNLQTGASVTNLCAGVYGVEITDNLGCKTTTNVVINSSSGITGDNVVKADETCAASCNGSVTVSAIGGTAPIAYHWVHNNSTSASLTGLCAGIYYCNMTDANGCTRTASVEINSATSLSVVPTVTQTACSASTGAISVAVSGGVGPYTYSWTPTAANSPSLTNLASGAYTLQVSDANLCSQTQVFVINAVNGPTLGLVTTDVLCNGVCNGTASLTIGGGTAPYTTSWSTGASTPDVNSLCPGGYTVTVTDNAGCTSVKAFIIKDATQITFSTPDIDNPLCFGTCNGQVNAVANGGSLPFTYSWTPTGGSGVSESNLCAGNYSVLVTDAHGCTATQSFTLIQPPALSFTAAVVSPTCSAATDGSIDITVTGGTPAYTYTWTGAASANTEDLSNLSTGTYSLHLSDANGCTKDTVITLNPQINVIAVAGNDTSLCETIPVTLNGSASGGAVSYSWSQLPSGTVISTSATTTVAPAAGTSTFVLTVANGNCIDSDTIVVTTFALPDVDAGPFISLTLFDHSQIGGNPTSTTALTYTWSPGLLTDVNVSNPTTTNTITTQYTVTVTDANGCTNFDTVTVNIVPQIRIPNGFSPNGDGKNDTWVIDYIFQFPNCTVEVYNRWGEQLFYSTGYATPWDGRFKGKELPVGTYYYVVNLNDPDFPTPYTGPLTIFR